MTPSTATGARRPRATAARRADRQMSAGAGGAGRRADPQLPAGAAGAGHDEEGAEPGVGDGRRLRRERNRQAVVGAMLDLYREGTLRPSSAEVAERAGLSPRSLFRYFEDVDDLCRAAIARHVERIRPLNELTVDPGDPPAVKATALAAQRVQVFGAIGSVGVAARLQAPFHDVIQAELTVVRRTWRQQVSELFAAELADLGPAAAAALAAADVLCSFESYLLLRDDHGLAPARIRTVLADGLVALLAPRGPRGPA